jgi:hypothetical protein
MNHKKGKEEEEELRSFFNRKDRHEWSICSFWVLRGYSLNINWKQGTTAFRRR